MAPDDLHSLERKVLFGFVLALTALLLAGALSYITVLRFREDAGLVDSTHQVLNALRDLRSSLALAGSAQRMYLISGQEVDLQPYDAAVQTVGQQMHQLRELTVANSTQQQNLNALEPRVANRLSQLQGGVEARRAQGFVRKQTSMAPDLVTDVQDKIRVSLATMESEGNRALSEHEGGAQQGSVMIRILVVAGSLLALSLLMIALFYVEQGFARTRRMEENLRFERDALAERIRKLTKSEVTLRTGEERIARIFDSMFDAVITFDEQQRIIMFNPAAEQMFGCPASDAIGAPFKRFLPMRFRNALGEHIRMSGGNGLTRWKMDGVTPLCGLRANGEEFLTEASISQVTLENGKLFIAVVQDVTETSKAKEVSSMLAAIVESSDDAIISKTLGGVITSWNAGAEKLFGYTAAEAVGKRMAVFFPPERQEEEQELLRRIARGETIDHFETERIRKDGKWINVAVTISPLRDASGKVVGASKIARDITERKRTEEQLRHQASLLDLAPALVRDMQNRIVLWTRGAEQIYGYTRDEALGRISHELLRTEFYQPLGEIEKILRAQGVWEGKVTHRDRDGTRVVVASHWVLHRDSKGKATKKLELSTDVTALKCAEA